MNSNSEAVEWNGPRITHLSPTYRHLISLPSPTLPFEFPSNPPQISLQSQPNPPRISLESSTNLQRISLEAPSNHVKSWTISDSIQVDSELLA